ncbi:MAG: glycosyltransferase family 4 protein [Gilvibacter sp.]
MTKALIITYYWPPAGGPGVQRWLKFATYLPEYEVTPIVYIPENPNYAIVDDNISAEVPSKITIVSQPIKEPYKLAKKFSKSTTQEMSRGILPDKSPSIMERLMLFVRGNFFIPDARVGWVKPSVKYLKDYIRQNPIDVVITTGPPHSVHLIGLKLKSELGCTWLADFRDPWTTIGYHSKLHLSKRAANKHKKLEAQVLNEADQVLVTSPTTAREFEDITTTPVAVITNGYDASHATAAPTTLDGRFSIAHIGSFLTKRNPNLLWEVLAQLANEIDSFKADLNLVFAGYVSPQVLESVQKYNLSDSVSNKGYLSHNEAIILQKESQLLLISEIDSAETKCIIPGKLFEYFMAGRPIVAIGPKGSDIKPLIDKTGTGSFFDYSEKEELKAHIKSCYEQYRNDSLTIQPIGIAQFSRKNLTGQLANLIDQVVSR